VDIVKSVEDGTWQDSPYSGQYRTGIKEGAVKLAPFGKNVPQEVQDAVAEVEATLLDGSFYPFTGPIYDQEGNVRIAEGEQPPVEELEASDYLIQGVVGKIPQ
jgi:basic membrane lipoprotein Med (substrate-binding protein (PBP1-ABC) superfamily)